MLGEINNFMAENKGITVEPQFVPIAEYKKQLSIGAAAGKLPDVGISDAVDTITLAATDVAVDITDLAKGWSDIDQFYKGPLDSATYKDKIYGIPYYTSNLALMYNKKLFAEAGIKEPPKTWNELEAYAKILTKGDVKGFAMCLAKSEESTFQVMPFVWQAGADYNTLNTTEGKSAFQFIYNMMNKGYMSRECLAQGQNDINKSMFMTGKAGMVVGGLWFVAAIQKDAPDLDFGVALFPESKSTASALGGGNLVMYRNDNRAASWKLIQHLTSEKALTSFCEKATCLPPRMDSANNSEFLKNNEYYKVFSEQLATTRPRGPHPSWPQISSEIQNAVQSMMSGEKTVDKAVQDADAEIQKIIAQ